MVEYNTGEDLFTDGIILGINNILEKYNTSINITDLVNLKEESKLDRILKKHGIYILENCTFNWKNVVNLDGSTNRNYKFSLWKYKVLNLIKKNNINRNY